MGPQELKEKLELHALWIEGDSKGKRANLQGADLWEANLQGAYLYGANLRWANLTGTDLQGADLQGADLKGAYLYGANLQGANLQGADLKGADLKGADLKGADLLGAKLEGVNLEGVKTSYSNTWAKTFFFKGACSDALQWVEEQNLEDLNELVKNCPNPEWITWLKEKMILTHRKVNQHA